MLWLEISKRFLFHVCIRARFEELLARKHNLLSLRLHIPQYYTAKNNYNRTSLDAFPVTTEKEGWTKFGERSLLFLLPSQHTLHPTPWHLFFPSLSSLLYNKCSGTGKESGAAHCQNMSSAFEDYRIELALDQPHVKFSFSGYYSIEFCVWD